MKNILIAAFIIISFKSFSQTDTTKLLNVSFSARVIEYISPSLFRTDDDDKVSTFLKWRTIFRASAPTGNTSVITDTIPVATMVFLYNYVLANPEGYSATASFKAAISPYRTSNSYFDRLCTDLENTYSSAFLNLRAVGRRLLTGK